MQIEPSKKLPDGWQMVKLGEIGEAIIGLTYSPKDVVSAGGMLVLRSSNVKDGKICYDDQVLVTTEVKEKLILKEGDILICSRNGSRSLIGKNAYIEREDAGNTFGAFMTVYRTDIAKFAKYLFQSSYFMHQIRRDLGPTINQVTTGNLNAFTFYIPPAKEQNRIVAILETWDQAIRKLTQKIEKKESIKKGLMQKLLTGKVRLPGFTDRWVSWELNEVCKRVTRRNEENNQNILTISAQDGLISQNNFFGKRIAAATLENYRLLLKGDFAYNKSYSNGYPMGAIKRLDADEKGIVSSLYIVFTPHSVDSDFLKHYFDLGLYNKEIAMVAQEGARNHGLLNIGLDEFFAGVLHVPQTREEQLAIAMVLNNSVEEISMLKRKLFLFKKQRSYLLNNLVAGKIRIPESIKVNQ